jgi:hypothetical protein
MAVLSPSQDVETIVVVQSSDCQQGDYHDPIQLSFCPLSIHGRISTILEEDCDMAVAIDAHAYMDLTVFPHP